MNCISITCNSDCNQGRSCDCIDRAHQANITARKAEWDQDESGHSMPQEAGNVWFVCEEPMEEPSFIESIAIYAALFIGLFALISIIFMVAGWAYVNYF